MKYPPNQQQAKAVAEFDANLLVTAGAGTGKTSVLTNKFLRLLEERRAEVGDVVAITFTKKAAAEMRDRVQQAIRSHIEEATAQTEAEFWKIQLLKSESARISTFHSFCLGLLRERPLEAGIPPVNGILNEGEVRIYLSQTIETVILEYFQERSAEEEKVLTAILLEFGWDSCLNYLAGLYQKIRETGATFDEVFKKSTEILEDFINHNSANPSQLISEVEEFQEFCSTTSLSDHAAEIVADLREKWAGYRSSLENLTSIDDFLTTLVALKKTLPKNVPALIKDRIVEIHDLADKLMQLVIDRETLIKLSIFGDLLIRIDQSYQSLKKEQGALDFSDQLILVRDLLKSNPGLTAELRKDIKYLLVDEFQDTNSLQMEIVDLLTGSDHTDGRLMAVGDIKQSIYRFRGSEADLIAGLAERLREGQGRIIPLIRNYRTDQLLIKFMNEFFARLFTGEIFNYEPLEAVREGENSGIELIFTGSHDRSGEPLMVARRIKQLVRESGREYGEIVLLFRAGTSIHLYQQALQSLDIPYYSANGRGFYDRTEIADQLNLLKLVQQSYNGVALLGLLKSPYVGLSDESLFWLSEGKDLIERFYQCESYSQHISEPEQERIMEFRILIGYLQKNRECLNISEIIRTALERTNYREILWTLPNAGQRLANLEKLLQKADEFIEKGFHDLNRFLEFIEKLEEVEVLEGEAQTEAETGNAVRLMTIHRSKGLEFPVVIIPELDRSFSNSSQGRVAFHKTTGLGLTIKYGENETAGSSVWKSIKELDKREELSELKRVLYVALTRAKEQLILVGSGCSKSRGKTLEAANNWMKWFELILPLENAGSEIDFHGTKITICRDVPPAEASVSNKNILEEMIPEIQAGKFMQTIDNSGVQEIAAANTGVAEITKTFKVSELLAYKKCGRRYFWEYRAGVKGILLGDSLHSGGSSDNLGSRIGNFIHQALRQVPPEWPENLWQESFRELPAEKAEQIKADLIRMLQNFQQSEFNGETGELWDEVPFMFKLRPHIRVEGRFDRLLQKKSGELVLVDYKTHRISATEADRVATGYFWQLQIYGLAVEMLWGRLPEKASLYFLYPNRVVDVPLDNTQINRIKSEIADMARIISEESDFSAYPPGDNCSDCNYWRFCNSNS